MRAQPIPVALMVALLLAGCGPLSSNSAQSTAPASLAPGDSSAAPTGGTYLDVALPQDVLAAPLQDQSGRTFTLASLKGKLVVIANFLTTCHDICPLTSANMRTIAAAVSAAGASSKVAVLEVTVDPERDTPARLTAYEKLYGGPTWTLATGAPTSLDALWQFFGVPAKKVPFTAQEQKSLPRDWQTGKLATYDMQHADIVLIIAPNGHWRWLDLGSPGAKASEIPKRLLDFLSEDGKQNLAQQQEVAWTSQAVIAALNSLGGLNIVS